MNKFLPTALLIIGLVVVGFGLMRKDEGQASLDLGVAEIEVGKSDSAFSGYFIVGGILAAAGLVMLVSGKKS